MNVLKKTFVATALACGASWLLKMVAIAATGGADSESPIVDVLWATGMLSFLVAAGTGTGLLLGRAPVWLRVAGGIVAVPVAFAALDGLGAAAKSMYPPDGWFREETSLVIAAVVMGALGLGVARGLRRPLA